MYQTTDAIIIKTMVAGVKPEDLAITIKRNGNDTRKQERNPRVAWNDFSQRALLGIVFKDNHPASRVEPEDAEAIEKHGLLTLKLPKINKEKMANLRVKSI